MQTPVKRVNQRLGVLEAHLHPRSEEAQIESLSTALCSAPGSKSPDDIVIVKYVSDTAQVFILTSSFI